MVKSASAQGSTIQGVTGQEIKLNAAAQKGFIERLIELSKNLNQKLRAMLRFDKARIEGFIIGYVKIVGILFGIFIATLAMNIVFFSLGSLVPELREAIPSFFTIIDGMLSDYEAFFKTFLTFPWKS